MFQISIYQKSCSCSQGSQQESTQLLILTCWAPSHNSRIAAVLQMSHRIFEEVLTELLYTAKGWRMGLECLKGAQTEIVVQISWALLLFALTIHSLVFCFRRFISPHNLRKADIVPQNELCLDTHDTIWEHPCTGNDEPAQPRACSSRSPQSPSQSSPLHLIPPCFCLTLCSEEWI